MGKIKRLVDVYRFPGLVPLAQVRGLFRDPYAVVITLRRRRGAETGTQLESRKGDAARIKN